MFRVQLEMRRCSPSKVMERTHEEATEALHACAPPLLIPVRLTY